jgi:hypothetical protein
MQEVMDYLEKAQMAFDDFSCGFLVWSFGWVAGWLW